MYTSTSLNLQAYLIIALSTSMTVGCASVCSTHQKNILVVDTDAHRVYQCEGGKVQTVHKTNIGYNGSGRTHPGDARTLTGTYPLYDRVKTRNYSSLFGKRLAFGSRCKARDVPKIKKYCRKHKIPCCFSDCAYSPKGKLLGTCLGLHAPPQKGSKSAWHWLGSYYPTLDATLGCTGLSTLQQVDRIEKWVRKKRVKSIQFLGAKRTNIQVRQGTAFALGTDGETAYALDVEWRRRSWFRSTAPSGLWSLDLGYSLSNGSTVGHEAVLGFGLGVDHGTLGGLGWTITPGGVVGTFDGLLVKGARITTNVTAWDDFLALTFSVERLWNEDDESSSDIGRFTIDIAVGHLLSVALGI